MSGSTGIAHLSKLAAQIPKKLQEFRGAVHLKSPVVIGLMSASHFHLFQTRMYHVYITKLLYNVIILNRRELWFSKCLHLRNPWNDNKEVKICRDGQVRHGLHVSILEGPF